MEYWNGGRLEDWNDGVGVRRNIGMMDFTIQDARFRIQEKENCELRIADFEFKAQKLGVRSQRTEKALS
jgi:hypothetical protein